MAGVDEFTIDWPGIGIAAALVALTVPGFVRAVRALPAVDRRVMAGVKPWACDICMCFWSTGLWTAGLALLAHDPYLMLACGPAYTVALNVLEFMQRPPAGSEPFAAPPGPAEAPAVLAVPGDGTPGDVTPGDGEED